MAAPLTIPLFAYIRAWGMGLLHWPAAGPKNSAKDNYRLAQAGYDRIAKAARITKRNAALIVGRLIADFTQ